MTEKVAANGPKTRAFRLYSALLQELAALGGNEDSFDEAIRDRELVHNLALVINRKATLIRKVFRDGRGMEFTFAGDKIITLKSGKYNVELGGEVVANGRFFAQDGAVGYVVNIALPDQDGRTSNIIDVVFKGAHGISKMKLKDLRPFGRES